MDTEDIRPEPTDEADMIKEEAFWPGVRPPTLEAVDNMLRVYLITKAT